MWRIRTGLQFTYYRRTLECASGFNWLCWGYCRTSLQEFGDWRTILSFLRPILHLLPLLKKLKSKNIFAVGTILQNRLHGCPLASDKELSRGCHDQFVDANSEVTVVKWMDTKLVILASTFCSAEPMSTCQRYVRKEKQRKTFPCPNIVKQYNRHMGGVDLHDMLKSLYSVDRKGKKFYLRLCNYLFGLCVINGCMVTVPKKLPRRSAWDDSSAIHSLRCRRARYWNNTIKTWKTNKKHLMRKHRQNDEVWSLLLQAVLFAITAKGIFRSTPKRADVNSVSTVSLDGSVPDAACACVWPMSEIVFSTTIKANDISNRTYVILLPTLFISRSLLSRLASRVYNFAIQWHLL